MNLNNTPMLGSTLAQQIGGGIMDVARSGAGLFKSLRGDTGNQIVEGAPVTNYANLAVYGTLAALALLVVVKSPKGR